MKPGCTCLSHKEGLIFFFFFFWFGFYGPFKNISLISSRSFIEGGRKPENPEKNHLTIPKQNLKEGLIISNGSEKIKNAHVLPREPQVRKRCCTQFSLIQVGQSFKCLVHLVIQSLANSTRIMYWRKWKSFTKRNDQAKNGQESTFFTTTPPLISVRLLSLFWLLKRWKF